MADLSDSANWFEVDGSNNRPPPNGWPEGMMPSGVNDTARADKGALKRFWDKINPVQIVTPASGVYTFTTSNPAYPAAYSYGEIYSFTAGGTSSGGDNFQVNALGPKPILKYSGTTYSPIIAGDITETQSPCLTYDNSLNAGSGAFILHNPFVPISGNGAGGTTLGGSLSVSGSLTAGGNAYLGGNTLFFNGNTSGSQGPFIALDGTNAVSRLGPGGGAYYFENNAGTPLVTINNGGDLGQFGPYIYLNNSSGVVNAVGGPLIYGDANFFIVKPGGGNLGFQVQDYNGIPRFTVSGDGHLSNNGHPFAFCGGGYNQLYDAAGNVSVFLGSGINFYRNTTHQFQTIAGGLTQMTLDGGGNAILAGNLTVNGNISGAQVFIGGLQLFNAGGWLQAANIRASSQLYTDGNATVIGNLQVNGSINCATISCGNYGTVNAGAITASGDIHAANLYANGSLFVGGLQVYNLSQWLFSPSSMQTAGMIQANAANASALYAPNGGVYAAGAFTTTSGGTAVNASNGNVACQNVAAANDINASGVFRCSAVRGARLETIGGSDWGYMSLGLAGGGYLFATPDSGSSGFSYAPSGTFSDARLKTDVRDTKIDALAAICATPVRRFKWNAEGKKLMPNAGPVPCGLIAQELAEVIPGAVGVVPLGDNMRHIIDPYLTPYLIRAMQQLADRVAALEVK